MHRVGSAFIRRCGPAARVSAVVVAMLLAQACSAVEPAAPVNIGSRLELLVDEFLIDSRQELAFELHRPVRAGTVLQPEFPWEGSKLGHVSILRDGDLYRMYYRGHHDPGYSWSEEICTCYAESPNGIDWSKPDLRIVEWEGSTNNNIVTRGQHGAYLAPFRDERPGVPAEQRYKSLAGNPPFAMVSPDGIAWSPLQDEPVMEKPRFGIALWDPRREEFLAYVRAWRPHRGERLRSIALAVSSDFVNWSQPELLDFGDAPGAHLYWNMALPYFRARHFYLGFPMRLREYTDEQTGEKRDWTDAVFAVSRDGLHFHLSPEAFVRPGLDVNNWQPHVNMMAYGIVPTSPQELSLYLTNAAGGVRRLQRLTLRTDGFVSLRARYSGGELTTRPLVFAGEDLWLNVSTSAVGSLRVELQHEDGTAIPGFALDDCRPLTGDAIAHRIEWTSGADVAQHVGTPARLRFVMHDADLYSFRFQ